MLDDSGALREHIRNHVYISMRKDVALPGLYTNSVKTACM